MRIAAAILLILLLATSALAWSGCGVTFDVPDGWKTEQEGKPAKGTCTIGISPKGRKQMVARSRWDDDKLAVHVIVFRGTLAAAAKKLDFEKNEAGQWGKRGFRGMWTRAETVRFGPFRGWRSESLTRGFAREGLRWGSSRESIRPVGSRTSFTTGMERSSASVTTNGVLISRSTAPRLPTQSFLRSHIRHLNRERQRGPACCGYSDGDATKHLRFASSRRREGEQTTT